MENHIHDAIEIMMMSLALGMDAFSLAVGLGLQGLSRNRAVVLCAAIGIFHMLMTLMGIYAGIVMHGVLGQVAQWFGAVLLLGLGLHMAYTTLFQREQQVTIGTTAVGLLAFSAGVSIDALSVGFSLGLRSAAYGIASAMAFALTAAWMCGLGLFIGKRANRLTGVYGELIGALILLGYGIHFLLG